MEDEEATHKSKVLLRRERDLSFWKEFDQLISSERNIMVVVVGRVPNLCC